MTNETRVVPVSVLAEAIENLKFYLEDVGGCDHSVGICCCSLTNTLDRLEAIAAPTTQPEASTTNSDEISSKLVDHPAHTHCENCGCTWLDDGLNPAWCPYCKATEPSEVERLAVEVADSTAWDYFKILPLATETPLTTEQEWKNDHSRYNGVVKKMLLYLDLRGLLEHHPDNPELVRVGEKP